MKTNEKLQSFVLPFMGGLIGILTGYLYTLRYEANTTYALVLGCVIGVIIGAFATKVVTLQVPAFLKKKKVELPLIDAQIKKYNRRREIYLFVTVIIPEILLSVALFGICWFVVSKWLVSSWEANRDAGIFLGVIYWFFFAAIPLVVYIFDEGEGALRNHLLFI